jgi:hypothetical protein
MRNSVTSCHKTSKVIAKEIVEFFLRDKAHISNESPFIGRGTRQATKS